MNTLPVPAFGRSLGLKLLLVCFLVLLMGIPALFISGISFERMSRANEVTREVGARYGGPQAVTGPILVLPYIKTGLTGDAISGGEYVIFPEDGRVDVGEFKTTIRKRSLFRVPTYQAGVDMAANFTLPELSEVSDEGINLVWDDARILIGVSDLRGLREDATLTNGAGKTTKFEPARMTQIPDLSAVNLTPAKEFAMRSPSIAARGGQKFMQVKAGDFAKPGARFDISARLELAGSQKISVIPFAKTTKVNIKSDWPHPGFTGNFAPAGRTITKDGFEADWTVPFLARGLPAHGRADAIDLSRLNASAMQVNLVNPVNPYQKVNRSLKYSVLFIGLVFLTYFLFETIVGVRVHAAQYVLIGLAQAIFYLLLLAFSEHIGFGAAFACAAFATIAVTAGYAGAVFGGRKFIVRAAAVFGMVYGLLYVLMRMEDFALMVGALTSFLAIAGTMYLTRNVNWYGKDAADASRRDAQAPYP